MLGQTAAVEQWTRLHFRHVPDACLFAYFLCRGEPIWLLMRLTQCQANQGWPVERLSTPSPCCAFSGAEVAEEG